MTENPLMKQAAQLTRASACPRGLRESCLAFGTDNGERRERTMKEIVIF
jgi:hypothetical protein